MHVLYQSTEIIIQPFQRRDYHPCIGTIIKQSLSTGRRLRLTRVQDCTYLNLNDTVLPVFEMMRYDMISFILDYIIIVSKYHSKIGMYI